MPSAAYDVADGTARPISGLVAKFQLNGIVSREQHGGTTVPTLTCNKQLEKMYVSFKLLNKEKIESSTWFLLFFVALF